MTVAAAQQDAVSDAVERVGESLQTVGVPPAIQGKILLSLAVVVLIWLGRRLLLRLVTARLDDPRSRYQWAKSSAYVGFVLLILLLGQIWLEAIRNLGTFLGLLSAGLAIALGDLVTNVAGWAFIMLRRPFAVGDRVQVGEHRGDVVDIRVFQFTLLEIGNWVDADQSTGRIIHVPNQQVFSQPLANYTAEFPYVWHEIPVLLTFESDWKKAKRLFGELLDEHVGQVAAEASSAVRRASRKFLIFYRTLTPIVYTEVKDSGVLLTLRYIAPARQRRGLSEKLWEAVLDTLADEPGIDLAYPTQRVYLNPVEGKPEARAPLPPGWEGGDDAP